MNANILLRSFVVLSLIVMLFGAIALPTQVGAADGPGNIEVIPDAFIGTWSGIAVETVSGTVTNEYPVTLSLLGGAEKTVVGTSDYPNFPCGGEIILLVVVDEVEITGAERLTYGQDVCADGGFVHLTHNTTDDTILLEVFAVTFDASITATLTRGV